MKWLILSIIAVNIMQACGAQTDNAREMRIVDGDTFWADGVKYRLDGIDTPEIHKDPRSGYRCAAELEWGLVAKDRARELLTEQISITVTGEDYFGRTLARVTLPDGRDYGAVMMAENLAEEYPVAPTFWCEREDWLDYSGGTEPPSIADKASQ